MACSPLQNTLIMKKSLIEFGKSADVQLSEEQLIAIKGGRRGRRRNNDNDNNGGDPGCPPDYED